MPGRPRVAPAGAPRRGSETFVPDRARSDEIVCKLRTLRPTMGVSRWSAMAGHTLLLNLLGSVALLVWATQMVRKGVMRAFGAKLRQAIGAATAGRTRACLTGLGVATALQSSSATGLLVVAFEERGLIALAPALAVMLGADIGSTLVVQALSLKTAALVPVLLIRSEERRVGKECRSRWSA